MNNIHMNFIKTFFFLCLVCNSSVIIRRFLLVCWCCCRHCWYWCVLVPCTVWRISVTLWHGSICSLISVNNNIPWLGSIATATAHTNTDWTGNDEHHYHEPDEPKPPKCVYTIPTTLVIKHSTTVCSSAITLSCPCWGARTTCDIALNCRWSYNHHEQDESFVKHP